MTRRASVAACSCGQHPRGAPRRRASRISQGSAGAKDPRGWSSRRPLPSRAYVPARGRCTSHVLRVNRLFARASHCGRYHRRRGNRTGPHARTRRKRPRVKSILPGDGSRVGPLCVDFGPTNLAARPGRSLNRTLGSYGKLCISVPLLPDPLPPWGADQSVTDKITLATTQCWAVKDPGIGSSRLSQLNYPDRMLRNPL